MILHVFTHGYTPESPLACIAVRSHTGEVRFFTDIPTFVEYFLGTDDKIVVGFNILKFDIPYLLLNCPAGMKGAFFKKINFSHVVDLFPVLTFQNKGVIKGLDFYLEQQKIEKKFPSDAILLKNITAYQDGVKQKLDAIHDLYWKLKG